MMSKVSIFDICGTLYRSNTTFDFLDYYLNDSKLYHIYRILYRCLLWRLFNKFTKHTIQYDITRSIAIYFLKGHSKKELLKAAQSFYNLELQKKENKRVIELLYKLNSNNKNQVIIASATLDFIAETIATNLNCKIYYSTTLSYKNEICKGTIRNDLLGKKMNVLSHHKPFENVYTDDITDCPVLSLSKNKYIIVYPRTINKWKNIVKNKQWNVNYLTIYSFIVLFYMP